MNEFLKKAVEMSKESLEKGRFPAGAVLVNKNKIIDTAISGLYPHIHIHAETSLIDEAMKNNNAQLEGYELYTSMEPCMMCLGKAYWAGIRKITYVLAKEDVNQDLAYESKVTTQEITSNLNDGMTMVQDKTLFDEALAIYKEWEEKLTN